MGTLHNIDEYRSRKAGHRERAGCRCHGRRVSHETIGRELAAVRRDMEKPRVLCLENLHCGIPVNDAGWDLIYSSGLLSTLPPVAARQVIKAALSRLKPGGRLLVANSSAVYLDVCDRCRAEGRNQRTEIEMAELISGLDFSDTSGHVIFSDTYGANVFLEVHKALTADCASEWQLERGA